ncbi:MAG: NAD(P)/FAD-dependent oxidoreductase [Bacteroidales bacterium]|nr:NAD(P)/FAD-dependent oxidoreductase [Bacteroidales bacterium]MCF6342223.1 NAD(P)/FAD-dependent oxidoreductase [Bacteroidales bacterium]
MKKCNHDNCCEHDRICVPDTTLPRIVVVGGGFAGLSFVKQLKNMPVQLLLIDKGNHHQFLPLLYQVATSGIEPDSIVFPFRKLLRNYDNLLYRMAEVTRINSGEKQVETNIGRVGYDFLVLATGSTTNFFGNENIAKYGLGLKSVPDALDIRSHLLQNLEKAAISCNHAEKESLSSVVIVGGGPAGVEMAGALAEFKKYVLPKDYPELRSSNMNIYLIEAAAKLLQDMPVKLSAKTLTYLRDMDVDVLLKTRVEEYDGEIVKLHEGNAINASALIWTAGIKGKVPGGLTGEILNRQNRVRVDPTNRLIGFDNVFAIGDVGLMQTKKYPKGHPMVAQVAIQQGRQLAKNLLATIKEKPVRNFEYKDKGSMATIGKKKAVANINKLNIVGFAAWIIWSFVHLMSLVGARNKFLIGLNWMWSYFSYDKGDRVIIRKFEPEQNSH